MVASSNGGTLLSEQSRTRAAVVALQHHLPNLMFAYVFGSYARREAQADSDLDLAVYCGARIPALERHRLAMALSVDLGVDVDLIDLAGSDNLPLAMQILNEGRVLIDHDPNQRADFEARTVSEYLELQELRADILSDIAKRGAVYG